MQDSQLSSPSYYENFYIGGRTVHTKPQYARLNNDFAWCARRGFYIQVDLIKNTTITGIATQGFSGVNDYYVSKYRVVHSIDGLHWQNGLVSIHCYLQYHSKVCRQSLVFRSSSLETRFSKISRIESRVEFQDHRARGESFEFRVKKLMSLSLD